jgi:hypothetical protein
LQEWLDLYFFAVLLALLSFQPLHHKNISGECEAYQSKVDIDECKKTINATSKNNKNPTQGKI